MTGNTFDGRVILIAGASGGLGRASALALAKAGAQVVLHGRNEARLTALYDGIIASGGPEPAFMTLDFSTAGDREFEALAYAVNNEFKRLDGLLFCVGHLETLSPLEQQTSAQFERTLKINLQSAFGLIRACLPLMKKSPDAAIALLSESHGHQPAAYWGAFALAKAGIEAMVRIWSEELEIYPQLRINALIPGPVDSPLRARTHPGELKTNLPKPADLAAEIISWLGPESRGRSGAIVELGRPAGPVAGQAPARKR